MDRTVLRLASLVPLFALAWYVSGLEPSVPLMDQWPLFDFAYSVWTGQAELRDVLAPHNATHVIIVPRVVMSAVAFATDGSMAAQIWVNFLLLLATFWAMTRITAHGPAPQSRPILIANVLTVTLLCSPVSYWAWVWTVGFCHFMVNLGVTVGALMLTPGRAGAELRNVAVAAIGCTLATFSRAEGLAVWLILTPSLLLVCASSPRRWLLVSGWASGALACGAIVLFSMTVLMPSEATPLLKTLLERPFISIGIALGLVGMPLGSVFGALFPDSIPVPRLFFPIGALVTAAYFGLSVAFLRDAPRERFAAALSWISIGLLGLLFVAAPAVARVGVLEKEFLGDFWPSNYSTTATLVTIAAIQLGALRVATRSGSTEGGWLSGVSLYVVSLLVICALLAASYVAVGPQALRARERTRGSDLCWELFHYLATINTCFLRRPSVEKAEMFEDIGFAQLRDDIVFDPALAVGRGAIESETPGHRGGPTAAVHGWVQVLDPGEDPAVFVSLQEQQALYGRAHVTDVEGDRARWTAEVYSQPDGTIIRAWLYDPRAGRLQRLQGQVVVARE